MARWTTLLAQLLTDLRTRPPENAAIPVSKYPAAFEVKPVTLIVDRVEPVAIVPLNVNEALDAPQAVSKSVSGHPGEEVILGH